MTSSTKTKVAEVCGRCDGHIPEDWDEPVLFARRQHEAQSEPDSAEPGDLAEQ